MNQHHVQEAYLESFRDSKTGKVWVYSKTTGEKFQKSTKHCTAEIDFQSAQLEKAQNDIVESPGITALKQLQLKGSISDAEYHLISQWTALHLIRNIKMRRVFEESGQDYETEFAEEFRKELAFSKSYLCFVHDYKCSGINFFVTSDHPIVEFDCLGDIVRFFVLSPQRLLQFSSRNDVFSHEKESIEDIVNSMLWASSSEIFSHRSDVDIEKLKTISEKWNMTPRLETQRIFNLQSPMRKVLEVFPGAQRALFRRYHIGGCSSCGFSPDETLAQVCARNGNLDVAEVLAHIQSSHEQDAKVLISPAELAGLLQRDQSVKLVDVRSREEFEAVNIAGSVLLSQDVMRELMASGSNTNPVVVIDHAGKNGLDAAAYFMGHGLQNVRCLRGGIDAWAQEVEPKMRRYKLG
jgi:rhodanese-related sulfurtransferase